MGPANAVIKIGRFGKTSKLLSRVAEDATVCATKSVVSSSGSLMPTRATVPGLAAKVRVALSLALAALKGRSGKEAWAAEVASRLVK